MLLMVLGATAALGSWAAAGRSAVPGAGYRLTRFVIFCCAADAEALQAGARGQPLELDRGPAGVGRQRVQPGQVADPHGGM
ncbi:MAG: hypothetical protein ACJ75N_11640 [Actinomycetes bacterium]